MVLPFQTSPATLSFFFFGKKFIVLRETIATEYDETRKNLKFEKKERKRGRGRREREEERKGGREEEEERKRGRKGGRQ